MSFTKTNPLLFPKKKKKKKTINFFFLVEGIDY